MRGAASTADVFSSVTRSSRVKGLVLNHVYATCAPSGEASGKRPNPCEYGADSLLARVTRCVSPVAGFLDAMSPVVQFVTKNRPSAVGIEETWASGPAHTCRTTIPPCRAAEAPDWGIEPWPPESSAMTIRTAAAATRRSGRERDPDGRTRSSWRAARQASSSPTYA